MNAVVRDLGGESSGDLFVGALDASRSKQFPERGHRVGELDQRPERVDRDRLDAAQATHCQSAHWTTATPSSRALTATIAACKRGRPPPSDASARKKGKTTSPNRGID